MLARSTVNAAHSKVKSLSQPSTVRSTVGHRRRTSSTVAAAAATPTVAAAGPRPTEPAAIAAFTAAARPAATREACVRLLEEAAAAKRVSPELVEGALAWLEADVAAAGAGAPANGAPPVEGTWRLVFSTTAPQRLLQYIPVKEDLTVDAAAGAVALASEVGPLKFVVRGGGGPAPADPRVVDLRFDAVDVLVGSSKIWTFTINGKPRTYTFYYRGDRISAARSSAGGLSLLRK